MSALHKGVIKWFDNRRGFGFIRQSSGKDIFVHYTVIEAQGFRRLEDGEVVYYEPHAGPKGPCALRVVKTGVIMRSEMTSLNNLDKLLELDTDSLNSASEQGINDLAVEAAITV